MPVKILPKDNKILRVIGKEVIFNGPSLSKIKKIIKDMKEVLSKELDGVAIAAPQIGVSFRIFVVAGKAFEFSEKRKNINSQSLVLSKESKIEDRVFINPVILKESKDKEWVEEGCLSVRYLYGKVRRAKKVRIKAQDEKGVYFELGGSGLLAQIFQHEIDHLNGQLFIDKAKDVIELTKEEYKNEYARRS